MSEGTPGWYNTGGFPTWVASLRGDASLGKWGRALVRQIERIVPLFERANCLAAAGYTVDEIISIIRNESGSTIQRSTVEQIYDNAIADILSGNITQGGALSFCFENYPDRISQEDIDAGRVLGPTPPPPPPPEDPDTQPPIVIPRPGEPPTDPADPGYQPPGTRTTPGTSPSPQSDRYASIMRVLLVLFERWWRGRQRSDTPQMPDIQIYPGVPGPVRPGPGPYPPVGGDDVAMVNTSLFGSEGGGGWGDIARRLITTAGDIWGPNQAAPGGARIQPYPYAQPAAAIDIPFVDIMPQGSGQACTSLMSPFAPGGTRGLRAKTHVQTDPVSGRAVWFKPAGTPLLWSGDLTACKRVRKVASRARRARGGR